MLTYNDTQALSQTYMNLEKTKEYILKNIEELKNCKNNDNNSLIDSKIKELEDKLEIEINQIKKELNFKVAKDPILVNVIPDINDCTELETDNEKNKSPLSLVFKDNKFYLSPANYAGKIDWKPASEEADIYEILFSKDLFFRRIREINFHGLINIDKFKIVYDETDPFNIKKSSPEILLRINIMDKEVIERFFNPDSNFFIEKFFNIYIDSNDKQYLFGNTGADSSNKISKINNGVFFDYLSKNIMEKCYNDFKNGKILSVSLLLKFRLNINKIHNNFYIHSIYANIIELSHEIIEGESVKYEKDEDIKYNYTGPYIDFIEPSETIIYDNIKFGLCSTTFDTQNCKINYTINNLEKGKNYRMNFGIGAFNDIDENDYVEFNLDTDLYKFKRDPQNLKRLYLDPQNYTISKVGMSFNMVLPNQEVQNKSTIWANNQNIWYEFKATDKSMSGYFLFKTNKPYKDAAWAIDLDNFRVEKK